MNDIALLQSYIRYMNYLWQDRDLRRFIPEHLCDYLENPFRNSMSPRELYLQSLTHDNLVKKLVLVYIFVVALERPRRFEIQRPLMRKITV